MSTVQAEGRPLLAVLDYGIGNLHSAHKCFSQVGAGTRLTDAKRVLAANGVTVRPPN